MEWNIKWEANPWRLPSSVGSRDGKLRMEFTGGAVKIYRGRQAGMFSVLLAFNSPEEWPDPQGTPLAAEEYPAYEELKRYYISLCERHAGDVSLSYQGDRFYAVLWAPWRGARTLIFSGGKWRWADGLQRDFPPGLIEALGKHELAGQWELIDALA